MYYAEGYDFEVSYVRDVGPGTMSLRLMATNYLEDATDNGTEVIDRAGENIRGTPDWLYRGTARYDWNDWTLNLTMRGHSDGVMDNDFIECAPGTCPAWKSPNFTINENDVEGEFFYDAYLSKDINFFGGEGEVFTSIKNIFDTDPNLTAFPLWQGSENRPAYLPVNRYLMDWLGRSWRVGMRFEV